MDRIVTVTCSKDCSSMLRQSESIALFVEPCEHMVIIEDGGKSLSEWQELLSPYYKDHKLVLKYGSSYNVATYGMNGWEKQQVYKLMAATESTDKYIVLDSKDFFIKRTNINEYNDYIGSNRYVEGSEVEDIYPTQQKTYASYFNVDLLTTFLRPVTPFVVNLKHFKYYDIRSLVNDFCIIDLSPSEFVFYNYMAPEISKNFVPHHLHSCKVWYGNMDSLLPQLSKIEKDVNCRILGIHRTVIDHIDPITRHRVNLWISKMGIKNLI